jgi:hypothetical protein
MLDKELYDQIGRFDLNTQEFIDKIYPYFPKDMDDILRRNLEAMEALLIVLYNNGYRELHPMSILYNKNGEEPNYILSIRSGFNARNSAALLEALQAMEHKYSGVKIQYLLGKIDLAENLNA